MSHHEKLHFVEKFAAARTSWGWVIILALWIGGWIGWQFIPGLPHFDMPPANERFGLLNFLLSIEATLSMPVLFMAMELASARDRAKLDAVLRATQELITRMNEVGEDVEAIEEVVIPNQET